MSKAALGAVAFLASGALIFGLVQQAGDPTDGGLASHAGKPAAPQAGRGSAVAAHGAFTDLGFDEAMVEATERDRWLLVKFGADWCAPCRQMDATTMKDPQVLDWIHENAVAVAVDIDEQSHLASRFEARSIPLTLLMRDGEVRGRVVGYRSTKQLLDWFDDVQSGRDDPEPGLMERLLGGVSKSLTVDVREDDGAELVRQRAALAKQMQREGQYEEALEHRLWLWHHALEHDRSMVGVRGSFWVGEMEELAAAYPPARQAFDDMRLDLEDAVFAGHAGHQELRDWLGLCRAAGEEGRLIEWYEQARDDQGRLPRSAQGAERRLYLMLIERGRYAEAGRVLQDVPREIWLQRTSRSTMGGMEVSKGLRTMTDAIGDQHARTSLAKLHAALLAAGRDREASQVADALIELLDDANSRLELVEAALDAGVAGPDHVRWFADVDAMRVGATPETLIEGMLPRTSRTPDLDELRRRLESADLTSDVTEEG